MTRKYFAFCAKSYTGVRVFPERKTCSFWPCDRGGLFYNDIIRRKIDRLVYWPVLKWRTSRWKIVWELRLEITGSRSRIWKKACWRSVFQNGSKKERNRMPDSARRRSGIFWLKKWSVAMPGVCKTVKPKTQLFYGICQTGLVRNNEKRVMPGWKTEHHSFFISIHFLIL